MPAGICPWEEIAMDFVGELPESEGFNAILIESIEYIYRPYWDIYCPSRDLPYHMLSNLHHALH